MFSDFCGSCRRVLPVYGICLAAAALLACGGDGSTAPADTTPPSVSLAVSDNEVVAAGSITLTATGTDDRGITRVEFYDGTTKFAETETAPYTATVSYGATAYGTKTYSTKAYDAAGNVGQSANVEVKVNVKRTTPQLLLSLGNSSYLGGASVVPSVELRGAPNGGGTVYYFTFSNGSCSGTIGATSPNARAVIDGDVTGAFQFNNGVEGTKSIIARYSGDASNATTLSNCVSYSVYKMAPTLTISLPKTSFKTTDNSIVPQGALSGASDNPIGAARWYKFNNGTCSGTLPSPHDATISDGGFRTYQFNNGVVGTYSFRLVYDGDTNNKSATSNCLAFSVVP